MNANYYPYTKNAFEIAIVEKIGNYSYPISPLAGVTSPIKPELLAEIAQAAGNEKTFKEAELIITFESAGAQLAVVVGQVLHLPYLIARKRKPHLPNEISFNVTTNFDEKLSIYMVP